MQGIEVGISKIGVRSNIALMKIKGYVDTTTSTQLYTDLTKLMNEGIYRFIIDMGAVNYVSSAGWGVFVGEIRDIRESGGDLKIVQMTPDVFEVFAMLEFNKILDYYETIEESINDFDISLGFDITKSMNYGPPVKIKREDIAVTIPSLSNRAVGQSDNDLNKKWISISKNKVPENQLPLVEKIKVIIIENPMESALGIRKSLNTNRFGYERVDFFKLRGILKKHNLETKEKRYRFYRAR